MKYDNFPDDVHLNGPASSIKIHVYEDICNSQEDFR